MFNHIGDAFAGAVYLIILLLLLAGITFFSIKKMFIIAIFWASLISNIFFSLFFLGSDGSMLSIFTYNIWPYINVALLIILTINYIKQKNDKK